MHKRDVITAYFCKGNLQNRIKKMPHKLVRYALFALIRPTLPELSINNAINGALKFVSMIVATKLQNA